MREEWMHEWKDKISWIDEVKIRHNSVSSPPLYICSFFLHLRRLFDDIMLCCGTHGERTIKKVIFYK